MLRELLTRVPDICAAGERIPPVELHQRHQSPALQVRLSRARLVSHAPVRRCAVIRSRQRGPPGQSQPCLLSPAAPPARPLVRLRIGRSQAAPRNRRARAEILLTKDLRGS
jgi:hypothetical protein